MMRSANRRAGSRLRILGGELRGRQLTVTRGVRPTGARAREALFSIWQQRVADARLLDLFAGAGGIGLEALSRGARRAVFVEGSSRVARALQENLRLVDRDRAILRRCQLPGGLDRIAADGPFDLIFADPPYAFEEHSELLRRAVPLLTSEGEMVLEHPSRLTLPVSPEVWQVSDQREYGDTRMTFVRRHCEAA